MLHFLYFLFLSLESYWLSLFVPFSCFRCSSISSLNSTSFFHPIWGPHQKKAWGPTRILLFLIPHTSRITNFSWFDFTNVSNSYPSFHTYRHSFSLSPSWLLCIMLILNLSTPFSTPLPEGSCYSPDSSQFLILYSWSLNSFWWNRRPHWDLMHSHVPLVHPWHKNIFFS